MQKMSKRDKMERSRARGREPVYEPIIPAATESFVCRTDDYPLSWSVWNSHPECEIHLVKHAGGTCHVGDHIGSFAPGDLFLVGRGLPHDWVTPLKSGESVKDRDVVLQFDEDRVFEMEKMIPELAGIKPFLILGRRGIVFHGDARVKGAALIETLAEARGLERISLFFALLNTLSNASERTFLSSAGFTSQASLTTNNVVREVLTWMAANYYSDVRLAQAATMAKMTETSFSRFFKRNTGTTFTHYLSELRIAKACELLVRTDLPVTVISSEVGYANLSNFNRSFKLSRRSTPAAYRKSAAETGDR
jgi:AraC-like DNA-binding protein